MKKWRVVLADDHVVLRDGLALLIDAQPDMEVVGQAGDGRAVVEQAQASQPDVVILDISMPFANGTQASIQVQQAAPSTRLIALTRHSESAYVRQFMQAGVRGYVLKQSAAEELLSAVRAVASGGTYLDPALTIRAVDYYMQTHARSGESLDAVLSQREADVVRLTALGYSNKEIATQLTISVKTVDTYKARAMEKLGLHSRAAIVRYALQQGWLEQS